MTQKVDAPAGWSSSRFFWLVLAAITLWKVIACVKLTLVLDEGYYHYWSLHPQLSYFDHPPLTGWLMTLSGMLLGNSVWTVRIWPLLGGIIFTLLGRALGRSWAGPATGNRAGVLLSLAPLLAGNGLIMTPDTALAVAWAAAIGSVWKALFQDARKFLWWSLAGVCAGLGFLSKYPMLLFFFGLGLFWLFAPGKRWEVFWGTAWAGLIALALFSPVIFWNAQNGWISFLFQIGHGLNPSDHSLAGKLLNYLGVLLLIATPFVGALAMLSSVRAVINPDLKGRLLAAFFWSIVLFFGYSALKMMVAANWAMLAFYTALILLARDWPAFPRRFRNLALGLLVVGDVLVMAYLMIPAGTPLRIGGKALDPNRIREFIGAQEVAAVVARQVASTPVDFVCADRHQTFGLLQFYAPELRDKLWLPDSGRTRFPWINDSAWAGGTALLVSSGPRDWNEYGWFDKVTLVGETRVPFKKVRAHTLYFYLGSGYHPERVKEKKD